MKYIAKFLLAVLFVTSAANTFAKPAPIVKISTSEPVDRHLSGFNAINVAGPFDVIITQGSTESVKVEAPHDVIDRILTEVNSGVLKIYTKHEYFHWGDLLGNHKKILIYV